MARVLRPSGLLLIEENHSNDDVTPLYTDSAEVLKALKFSGFVDAQEVTHEWFGII